MPGSENSFCHTFLATNDFLAKKRPAFCFRLPSQAVRPFQDVSMRIAQLCLETFCALRLEGISLAQADSDAPVPGEAPKACQQDVA